MCAFGTWEHLFMPIERKQAIRTFAGQGRLLITKGEHYTHFLATAPLIPHPTA